MAEPVLPSRRFLAMLPPALLATQSPDDVPVALALLGAVEEQWLLLAADVDRVLDDAFADSAAEWALPYLAQVLGLPPDAGRAEIGSATALRRRRGTPAALEDFATVVTGWPARVTEGWKTTLWSQQLRHPVRRTASLSMRAGEHLLAGSELDPVRRSVTPGGPHHPAAATATVYPWQSYRYDQTEVCPLADPGRFTLHPLGLPVPLYLRPGSFEIASDADDERPPGAPPAARPPRSPATLPLPATWRLIEALAPGEITYGPVWQLGADHPLAQGEPGDPALVTLTVDGNPLPWTAIGLTGLPEGGGPAPAAGQILLDPARGVIAIGSSITGTVRATFYRPVSGQLGALASTAQPDDSARTVIVVDPAGGTHPPGQIVVTDLDAAVTAALAAPAATSGLDVEIRLVTSDRLAAPAPITGTPAAQHWRIIAPAGLTPVIVGALSFDAADLTVDVTGCYLEGDVEAGASLTGLALNGVTMNPAAGRQLTVAPGAWTLRLAAGRSQLGPVRADLSAYPIELHDCVVDGAGAVLQPCGPPAPPVVPVPAVAAADRFPPHLVTTACTFAGPVAADTIEASDCLFLDGLTCVVTSGGYVRYSELGPDDDPQAHPPAHQCLTGPRPAVMSDGAESAGYYAPILRTPGSRGASPLLTGASDGGEIGAYHHARRGPLALRLAQRLAEMVPLTIHPHLVVSRSEE
ncbi:hypothetical protein ACPPVO_36405 [Dactylosporangium sp. McL0621]|uniref:hypothetical protein n=1 Tax=Dactylosporangium sp. McL0621 TaxID=3415678 RepID=UPI003CF8AE06